MMTRRKRRTELFLVLAVALGLATPVVSLAREHGHGGFGGHEGPAHQHFDGRFSHNHYYFDRGYSMRDRPHGGFEVNHERGHYWYDRGDWYRRGGFGWEVMGAPTGAFVPILPPSYTTVWFGGSPYYYANDTYYNWDGDRQGYEVVQPPAEIESAGTTQPAPSDAIFVYPKNGQSAQQQSSDRYECHHSAVEHTSYDPTQQGGGVPPDVAVTKRDDYFRAMTACLNARGYSVK